MKPRSKKELLAAFARTAQVLKSCGKNAQAFYVHQHLGQAMALLFALGYTEKENREEMAKIKDESVWFLHKRIELFHAQKHA